MSPIKAFTLVRLERSPLLALIQVFLGVLLIKETGIPGENQPMLLWPPVKFYQCICERNGTSYLAIVQSMQLQNLFRHQTFSRMIPSFCWQHQKKSKREKKKLPSLLTKSGSFRTLMKAPRQKCLILLCVVMASQGLGFVKTIMRSPETEVNYSLRVDRCGMASFAMVLA